MGTLFFLLWGLLPFHHKKGKKKKKLQFYCYYKLWIIFGSFFAPSLCHLPQKPICPLQELGIGRKEQGGPDFGMFLFLCAPPPFLAPGPLHPITAPPGAVLKGCQRVMSNRSCLGRLPSCLPFPPKSHCQKSHSLLGVCKSSACSR